MIPSDKRINIADYESLLHYIRQIGGAIGFKDLNSVYQFANYEITKLAGFQKESDMVGVSDENLNCDAASCADLFRQQDLEVINTQRSMQKLDIQRYADGELHFRLVTKSPLYNKKNVVVGISFNSQRVTPLLFKKISSLMREISKEGGNKIECSTFSLKESFDLNNNLSSTENSILFWFMHGKNAREIAHILNRNKCTVESHISNIKDKIECSKKSEVFDRAMELGWYNIIPSHLVF